MYAWAYSMTGTLHTPPWLSSTVSEWSGDAAVIMVKRGGWDGGGGGCGEVIYTDELIAAVPSVQRETLSSRLSAILWTPLGHPQLHQTKKSLPHAPGDRHYVTASELHGSQGWELIGHFIAVSASRPLSSEEVRAHHRGVITARGLTKTAVLLRTWRSALCFDLRFILKVSLAAEVRG